MAKLDVLLENYASIFTESPKGPSVCSMGKHVIETNTDQVVSDKIWPIAKKWENEIRSQIVEMEKYGIIKESVSPYNQKDKKEGKCKRFCVDFRSLNKKQSRTHIHSQMSKSYFLLYLVLSCFHNWILLQVTGQFLSGKKIRRKQHFLFPMVSGSLLECLMG